MRHPHSLPRPSTRQSLPVASPHPSARSSLRETARAPVDACGRRFATTLVMKAVLAVHDSPVPFGIHAYRPRPTGCRRHDPGRIADGAVRSGVTRSVMVRPDAPAPRRLFLTDARGSFSPSTVDHGVRRLSPLPASAWDAAGRRWAGRAGRRFGGTAAGNPLRARSRSRIVPLSARMVVDRFLPPVLRCHPGTAAIITPIVHARRAFGLLIFHSDRGWSPDRSTRIAVGPSRTFRLGVVGGSLRPRCFARRLIGKVPSSVSRAWSVRPDGNRTRPRG